MAPALPLLVAFALLGGLCRAQGERGQGSGGHGGVGVTGPVGSGVRGGVPGRSGFAGWSAPGAEEFAPKPPPSIPGRSCRVARGGLGFPPPGFVFRF